MVDDRSDDRMVDSFWDTLQHIEIDMENPLRGNPRKSIHKWWVFHVILHVWIDSNVHVQSVCLFKSSNPISLLLSKQLRSPLQISRPAKMRQRRMFLVKCSILIIVLANWKSGPHFSDPWARLTSSYIHQKCRFSRKNSAFLDPDIPDIWQIPRKFDGHATRQLTSPELRQLAGRAGRYGLTSLGVAACCQGGENVEVTSFLGKKYSHVGKTN